jgi:integrase
MLTDVALRALKPIDKPYKRSDGSGLYIAVQPNGKKHWRLAYRFGGKQKVLAAGSYPEVGLRAVREWRDEIRAKLKDGIDPDPEKSTRARKATRHRFEDVAREWLAIRMPTWSPRYANLVKGRLEADIFPVIGAEPISEITPSQVLQAIREIEQRGAVTLAHRVKNHCGEIFRYAIPDGRCHSDPCRDLHPALAKPKTVQHHAKVAAKDLPAFFVKLNADEGARLSHLALRWTMLTMVRTQETRFAEWSEFEGLDTPEPLWRIPRERMKMRSEHLVPLSTQAVVLLDEIRASNVYLAADDARLGRFLFPMAGSKTHTISENRMLDILYRMGLRGKATVHGFRGLASTVLNESGLFEPDWIEYQLAHVPGGVRAAYNSARYLKYRRKMMRWWGDYLEQQERKGLKNRLNERVKISDFERSVRAQ